MRYLCNQQQKTFCKWTLGNQRSMTKGRINVKIYGKVWKNVSFFFSKASKANFSQILKFRRNEWTKIESQNFVLIQNLSSCNKLDENFLTFLPWNTQQLSEYKNVAKIYYASLGTVSHFSGQNSNACFCFLFHLNYSEKNCNGTSWNSIGL